MKEDYTHLTIVVDRSGSMMSIKEDSEGGLNSLIAEQAAEPGEITVTLHEFDDKHDKVFGPIAAKEAPKYVLVPRGMTALYDAVGRAINDTGDHLRGLAEKDRPSKVIFAIVTDGMENSSREYSHAKIAAMIKEQTDKYNWEFVFLGANLDAAAVSAELNIGSRVQYKGTGASAQSSYNYLSANLSASRATGATMDSLLIADIDEEGNEVERNE